MPKSGLLYSIEEYLITGTQMHKRIAYAIACLLILIMTAAIVIGLIMLNRFFFSKVIKSDELHVKFAKSLADLVLIIAGILMLGVFFGNSKELGRILLGSTGLIVAIIGFAAQSALGDVIAGLMMGIEQPFRLGDKIVLENSGVSGTVRDMTIRHTVIHKFDGLYVIIPNSVINKEIIHNNSYMKELTGSYLEFDISYDSDIKTAMKIIHNAVISSKYTVEYAGDNPEGKRAAVYVTGFTNSSVRLRTTIWARNSDENFMACSDIMTQVKTDFAKYGIEIPYNYLNVVRREASDGGETQSFEDKQIYKDDIAEITKSVHAFCKAYKIKEKEERHLNLLAEELMVVMQKYLKYESYFNIMMNKSVCELHLKIRAYIHADDKKELMSIATMDEQDDNVIVGVLKKMFLKGERTGQKDERWSLKEYMKNMREDNITNVDISKTILVSLADDISITIKNGVAETVIYKKIKN